MSGNSILLVRGQRLKSKPGYLVQKYEPTTDSYTLRSPRTNHVMSVSVDEVSHEHLYPPAIGSRLFGPYRILGYHFEHCEVLNVETGAVGEVPWHRIMPADLCGDPDASSAVPDASPRHKAAIQRTRQAYRPRT